MSELAFDKDGEPIDVHPDCEWWGARVFQNPGARGTCATARDENGSPIYAERDAAFLDLKRMVGGTPGLYRLDQCDAGRARIIGAPAAYVLITEQQRNAGPSAFGPGAQDPMVLIVMELIRALGDSHRVTVKEQANMMRSAADVLRAADIAGISRRPAPPITDAIRAADDDGDGEEELEDDDNDDQPPPKHLAETIVERVLPKLEIVLGQYLAKKFKSDPPPPAAAPTPAPSPAPAPAPAAAPSAATATGGAAAGPSAATSSAPAAPPVGATVTESVEVTTISVKPAAAAGSDGAVRNAAAITEITPAQIDHLIAIRARLSPREQAIADLVRERMSPEMQAQWLAELSAMAVEQAVKVVRSMIPKPASKRPPGVPDSVAAPPTAPPHAAPATSHALAVSPTPSHEGEE